MIGKNNKGIEDENNSVILIRKIKAICKDLSITIANEHPTIEDLVANKQIGRKREILKLECEKLLEYPKFRCEAVKTLWKHCIYETICCCKSIQDLDDEEKNFLKKFISKSIAEISNLLSRLPADMQPLLLLYLGDLYRYSFTLCGSNPRDFGTSEKCYKKAMQLDHNNGRPYNQLALLTKESEPERAFYLFLRFLAQSKDAAQASNNVEMLNVSHFSTEEIRVFYNFIIAMLFEFSRNNFENARKEFDKCCDTLSKDMDSDNYILFVKCIQMCSLATVSAFYNGPNDEQFRYISSFLCQKMVSLLENCKQMLSEAEEDIQQNKRRKRKSRQNSSSSSTTSDSEPDDDKEVGNKSEGLECRHRQKTILWTSVITVAEFLNNCGEHFSTRKLPVSLKLQFQNLLKTFVDVLNELLTLLSPLMQTGEEGIKSCPLLIEWNIGNLFTQKISDAEKKFAQILSHYMRSLINSQKLNIIFDKYFQLNVSADKEKQTIDRISDLHLTHINELNERTSKIPVYVAPDHLAFLNSLPLIEKLASTSARQQTTIIVIARAVLTKLDKLKKETVNARESIRWIQNSLAKGRVRMLPQSCENFIPECLKFLQEKKVHDKQTLFLSILTTVDGVKEYEQRDEFAKFPALGFECVENFLIKITNIAGALPAT